MPSEREIEAAAREILWWRRCDGASREEYDQSFDRSLEQWRTDPDKTPATQWAIEVATDALEAAEAAAWQTRDSVTPEDWKTWLAWSKGWEEPQPYFWHPDRQRWESQYDGPHEMHEPDQFRPLSAPPKDAND